RTANRKAARRRRQRRRAGPLRSFRRWIYSSAKSRSRWRPRKWPPPRRQPTRSAGERVWGSSRWGMIDTRRIFGREGIYSLSPLGEGGGEGEDTEVELLAKASETKFESFPLALTLSPKGERGPEETHMGRLITKSAIKSSTPLASVSGRRLSDARAWATRLAAFSFAYCTDLLGRIKLRIRSTLSASRPSRSDRNSVRCSRGALRRK